MSMNQGEARSVQLLLDWVLNLAAFEHAPDVATDVVSDEEFVRIVAVLADRSHAVFGAGLRQDDAIVAARRLLGLTS